MCTGTAGFALQAGGAASSVIGSYFSGVVQNKTNEAMRIAYGAQADTARTNAAIANSNADRVLQVGDANSAMATQMGDINSSLIVQLGDLNAKVQEGSAALITQQGDFNVQADEQNAEDALKQGQQREQMSMLATAQLKGTQRASMAANGIALDSDTSVRVLTSSDYMGAQDVNTIHANAVRAAMGYRTQGVMDRATSNMAALEARGQALQTRSSSALQALNVKTNATFSALNYKTDAETQAMQDKMQAGTFMTQASDAKLAAGGLYDKSPALGAFGTLLSQGSALADKWYNLNKNGAA